MESHALATPPDSGVCQVDSVVDLRDRLAEVSDHVGDADRGSWEWCCELVRRVVGGPGDRARRRVVDDTIKGLDRLRGADRHQLAGLLGALDRGRPVAMSCWWPAAGTSTTTRIAGIDALDVPPAGPDRGHKSRGLVERHHVVALGYGRHDALPGGGYLIVLDPASHSLRPDGQVRHVPFTFVHRYAIALQSARVDSGLRPVGPTAQEPDEDAPASLPIGPYRNPADAQIARKARCADPRSSYTALFFSENAIDTARAKAICARCEVRDLCLARALERAEPYGVWGGEFVLEGEIVVAKRGRGRPRRIPLPTDVDEVTGMPVVA